MRDSEACRDLLSGAGVANTRFLPRYPDEDDKDVTDEIGGDVDDEGESC